MDRRAFLKSVAGAGTLSAAGALATPAISQRATARALRFVPQANLANFDPIWGTQYVVRNAAALVWDTLYGVDEQAAAAAADGRESDEVTPDCTDLDVPAAARPEIPRRRAGARQGRGRQPQPLDGARRTWAACSRPSSGAGGGRRPHLPLPCSTSPIRRCCSRLARAARRSLFIMPERIAKTDPFKQITDYVGSGPMRFARDEWVPGAEAVFEKFRRLRAAQRAGGLAGRRQAHAVRPDRMADRCRTPPPPRRRCRTARSTGGKRRCPTWCRCCGETATFWSISPIRSAISARSASTTCTRRSTTCGRAARC